MGQNMGQAESKGKTEPLKNENKDHERRNHSVPRAQDKDKRFRLRPSDRPSQKQVRLIKE